VFKLRMCLATATRGSVLPGCDDGNDRLRALLRDVAATRCCCCALEVCIVLTHAFQAMENRPSWTFTTRQAAAGFIRSRFG
jgi:hypothetical protein